MRKERTGGKGGHQCFPAGMRQGNLGGTPSLVLSSSSRSFQWNFSVPTMIELLHLKFKIFPRIKKKVWLKAIILKWKALIYFITARSVKPRKGWCREMSFHCLITMRITITLLIFKVGFKIANKLHQWWQQCLIRKLLEILSQLP